LAPPDKSSLDDVVAPDQFKLGTLEVRLATEADDIKAAQALRYQVFYEEMNAKPTADMLAAKSDFDPYDAVCDHLLVLDHARGARVTEQIVGTYRLIRRVAAEKVGGFYSASEYDITCLVDYKGEILELGRSCVHKDYRTRATMQLLWQGISKYVYTHNIDFLFGCASFPGSDPKDHAQTLSYLYYHHLAPPAIRPKALPERYVDMRMLDSSSFTPTKVFDNLKMDPRSGGNSLPPLIKGYIRVGGFVGDGAVVDTQFNTTDICIIVKTDLITERYKKHYLPQKA
jgi:L-ornithine Nalpha-acyltransferase